MTGGSGGGTPGETPPTDTPRAVQRMIDATNAGDTEAFLDAFTPDAYLEDWGRGFTGREELANWNRTDNIGKHAHFEALATKEIGGTYVVTLRVTGGGFNGTSDISFVLSADGEHIARLVISAD